MNQLFIIDYHETTSLYVVPLPCELDFYVKDSGCGPLEKKHLLRFEHLHKSNDLCDICLFGALLYFVVYILK